MSNVLNEKHILEKLILPYIAKYDYLKYFFVIYKFGFIVSLSLVY